MNSFTRWLAAFFAARIPEAVAMPDIPPAPVVPSVLDLAATLIESFEGFRSAPYRDGGGKWTIGYGSIEWNGIPVSGTTSPVTVAQANAMMVGEIMAKDSLMMAVIRAPVSINQHVALLSFVYNEGVGALVRSTMLTKLNALDYGGAAAEFPKWDVQHVNGVPVISPGILSRRMREMAIFNGAAL